jgi:SAM-dependent methyltransferase
MSLKAAYQALMQYDNETPRILAFIAACRRAGAGPLRVLDVGCGYGRNLVRILDAGHDGLGVEVNPAISAANVARGLPCVTVEEFNQGQARFDVILMSHVIEHFGPEALKAFMDAYLDRLEDGGHLVIATPLLTPYFFDDFDHVKPYLPAGILMVYGGGGAQVQYYSPFRLELKDIWFRRSAYRARLVRGRFMRSWANRFWMVVDLVGALAFRASGGLLGCKDAWVGVFEKVETRHEG